MEKWQELLWSSAGHFHSASARLIRMTSGPDVTRYMILIILFPILNHLSALHFVTHFLVWILKHFSNVTSLLNKF